MRHCRECGEGKLTVTRETYRYRECGLPNVILEDVEVRRCQGCGDYTLVINRLAELHRLITYSVATKSGRLTSAEIRFLRTRLGLDRGAFARRMGVSAETVSRWESEASSQEMGPVAERLLRLMALTSEPAVDYSPDILDEVAQGKATPTRVRLKAGRTGWKAAA